MGVSPKKSKVAASPPAQGRWKRFSLKFVQILAKTLRAIWSWLVGPNVKMHLGSIGLILVISGIALSLILSVLQEKNTVQDLQVPPALQELGYTPRVVTDMLVTKQAKFSELIQRQRTEQGTQSENTPISNAQDKNWYSKIQMVLPQYSPKLPTPPATTRDVSLPGMGITYNQLIGFLRQLFGVQERVLSGEITCTGSKCDSNNVRIALRQTTLDPTLFSANIEITVESSIETTGPLGQALNESVFELLTNKSPKGKGASEWHVAAGSVLEQEPELADLAIDEFSAALKVEKTNLTALNHRGRLYLSQSEFDKAAEDFLLAIKTDKNDVRAFINYTDLLSNDDYKVKVSKKNVSKPVEIPTDSNDPDAIFNKGVAHHVVAWTGSSADVRNTAADSAIKEFSNAIEVKNDFSDAYFNRGLLRSGVWENVRDPKLAIEDFTKVIELQPDNEDAYLNRGAVKSNTQDFDGAITDYLNAGNNLSASLGQGVANFNLKKWDDAIINLTEAGKKEGANLTIYPQLYLYLAQARADKNLPKDGGVLKDYCSDATTSLTMWPAAVTCRLLDKEGATPSAIISAAGNLDPNSQRPPAVLKNEQLCEANFFLGYHAFLNEKLSEAEKNELISYFKIDKSKINTLIADLESLNLNLFQLLA